MLITPSDLSSLDLSQDELLRLCFKAQVAAEGQGGANRKLEKHKHVEIQTLPNSGVLSFSLPPIWSNQPVTIEALHPYNTWQLYPYQNIDFKTATVYLQPLNYYRQKIRNTKIKLSYTTGFDVNISDSDALANPWIDCQNFKQAMIALTKGIHQSEEKANISQFKLEQHYQVSYFNPKQVVTDGKGGQSVVNTDLDLSYFNQFRPRFFSI